MKDDKYFSGKKIVITGVSGFIGSRLAKEFIRQGASVFALSRKTSDLWRIKDFVRDINWLYPDFNSENELTSCLRDLKPDFIYHLATYYSVDNNVDLSLIVDTNIKTGALLLKAAAGLGGLKIFVNAGTGAEYGDLRGKADEQSKLAPTTIYASTKAASTIILHQMAKDLDLPVTTLRLYNLFGEYEQAKRIVPYIILSMIKNDNVELTACEQEKDYSYIVDFIGAFMQAGIKHENAAGRLFNIGSGKTITMRRLVEEIIANFPDSGSKIIFGALPYRDNEMWYQNTSIEAAKRYLEWHPEVSLGQGMKKTVEWYKNNWRDYYG